MQKSQGIHLVSVLGHLEAVNALELRVFRKEISPSQAITSLTDFEKDARLGIFQLTPLPEKVFQDARQLALQTTARLGTRSVDLLHVAAAVGLGTGCLYSFDQRQRKLARTAHLETN